MPTTAVRTFEEYLKALRPYIRSAALGQAGRSLRSDREWMRHPFISMADMEQECRLKLWKVYQQHHEKKPWQDLCRIGASAVRRCLLDVIDRTQVRGQAGAFVVSLDAPLDKRHSRGTSVTRGMVDNYSKGTENRIFSDTIQDHLEFSPIEAAEASEQFERLSASLEETERLVLRELLAMSNRTLELFEDIRRKAPRTRQTDSVRFEAISKSLEVSPKVVARVVAKLVWKLKVDEQEDRDTGE